MSPETLLARFGLFIDLNEELSENSS